MIGDPVLCLLMKTVNPATRQRTAKTRRTGQLLGELPGDGGRQASRPGPVSTTDPTEQLVVLEHELLVEEVAPARVAAEAVGAGVPVEFAVRHPRGVCCNRSLAGITDFTEELVEAGHAVRVVVLGDVPLPRQGAITVPAAEMVDMPGPTFGLCVFPGKYDLITGETPRIELVSVVPLAVDSALFAEVDHIHQQLATCRTHEAAGVPAVTGDFGCNHSGASRLHLALAVMAAHHRA
jgi:hypothetical protein